MPALDVRFTVLTTLFFTLPTFFLHAVPPANRTLRFHARLLFHLLLLILHTPLHRSAIAQSPPLLLIRNHLLLTNNLIPLIINQRPPLPPSQTLLRRLLHQPLVLRHRPYHRLRLRQTLTRRSFSLRKHRPNTVRHSNLPLLRHGLHGPLDHLRELPLARRDGLQSFFDLLWLRSEEAPTAGGATPALLHILDGVGIEVVVVGQFFPGHDALVAGEEGHAGFAADGPFDHAAVGLTGVVDEAGDGAAGGVEDHLLVEVHEVVALFIGQSSVL